MTEMQREASVQALIDEHRIVVGQTTADDLRRIFKAQTPYYFNDQLLILHFTDWLEPPEPIACGVQGQGGWMADWRKVEFELDGAGVLRRITFSNEHK